MKKEQNHVNYQNSYALNKDGEGIEIWDAVSGRQGYYCPGCHREMQAVKSRLPNRISYFRHDAKDVLNKGKCTYSDFNERKKIAKEILVQLKMIKAPSLYKYPPNNENELFPMKLQSSKNIKAFKVLTERYFYEDTNGNVLWGDKSTNHKLTFLTKCDVVFLDQSELPTLIIQLVDKFGIKDSDKNALKILGINAVQVKLPRVSRDNVVSLFKKTVNTKWLYNYEQERAKYVSVSSTDSESVSIVDKEQRGFFEDSFICKQAEIRNLVRSITKCLESKHYRDFTRKLEDEISRVADKSDGVRASIVELQEKIKRELDFEFEREEAAIENNRSIYSRQEGRINKLLVQLEKRYKRKVDQVEIEERQFESRIDGECRRKGARGSTVASRKRDIADQIRIIERDFENERREVERIQRDREALPSKYSEAEESLRVEFENLQEKYRQKTLGANEEIWDPNTESDSELPTGLNEFADIRRTVFDCIEKQGLLKRYRAALNSLRSRAHKKEDQ